MELKRRGAKVAKPGAYNWCDKMVRLGFLTKEGSRHEGQPGRVLKLAVRGNP